MPVVEDRSLTEPAAVDGATRDARLTKAVAARAPVPIEIQRTRSRHEPFVPIAELRFETEIQIDQEALHFDPVERRGFVPPGALTVLRRSVYPASRQEREPREHESIATRLSRYFQG